MLKDTTENDRTRNSNDYPFIFPMTLTHSEFPSSLITYEQLGMPLGCCISPFISIQDRSQASENIQEIPGTHIARCSNCSAYINSFCEASSLRWICSLCGTRNNFTRAMIRYRQVDLRLLTEMKNIVADYPLPSREVDVNQVLNENNKQSIYKLQSEEKPVIHIFLVQESMSIDSMEATIESLTTALQSMHPDIQVVLLTFSNRIGVYRFCSLPMSVCPAPVLPAYTSRKKRFHSCSVQHVHMTPGGGTGPAFEGQEWRDVLRHQPDPCDVATAIPLSTLADFLSVARPVGLIREALLTAVAGLGDAVQTASASSIGRSAIPQVLLGPALEAVMAWVIDPSPPLSAAAPSPASEGLGPGLGDQLLGVLKGVSRLLLGGDRVEEEPPSAPAAIDRCTGVCLHLFLDAPQDLPLRSHPSVPAAVSLQATPRSQHELLATAGAGWPMGVDPGWVKRTAGRVADTGLCANVWWVSSFPGSPCDLAALAPLAATSGGVAVRCVLGAHPQQQRQRLAEQLRRAVCQQRAWRCLIRLRHPSCLVPLPGLFSGPSAAATGCPGAYKASALGASTVLSFQFSYRDEAAAFLHHPVQGAMMVLQLAVSYNTLVESSSRCDGDEDTEEEEEEEEEGTEEEEEQEQEQEAAAPFSYLSTALSSLGVAAEDTPSPVPVKQSKRHQTRRLLPEVTAGCYSARRRLVAVRRLRLITVGVDTSAKVPRVVASVQPSTVALLLTRRWLQGAGPPSARWEELLQAVAAVVAAAAQARAELQPSPLSIDTLLAEVMRHPSTLSLLRSTYGAADLLLALGDRDEHGLAELAVALMHTDAHTARRLFYPELIPLDASLAPVGGRDRPLPLGRAAMLLADAQAFLLDAGTDIVLYSALPRPGDQAAESVAAGDSHSLFARRLPQNPQPALLAEGDSELNRHPLRSASWLNSDLRRRLLVSQGLVPLVSAAAAGCASADLLSHHLLEDQSRRGPTGCSFDQFVHRIREIVVPLLN